MTPIFKNTYRIALSKMAMSPYWPGYTAFRRVCVAYSCNVNARNDEKLCPYVSCFCFDIESPKPKHSIYNIRVAFNI